MRKSIKKIDRHWNSNGKSQIISQQLKTTIMKLIQIFITLTIGMGWTRNRKKETIFIITRSQTIKKVITTRHRQVEMDQKTTITIIITHIIIMVSLIIIVIYLVVVAVITIIIETITILIKVVMIQSITMTITTIWIDFTKK